MRADEKVAGDFSQNKKGMAIIRENHGAGKKFA